MKIVAVIFTIIWTGFWFFIGISSLVDTPKQIEKDRDFINTKIKPSVIFIKEFKKSFNKLPTNREFYTWEREYYKDYSSDLTQQVDSLIPGFGTVNYIRRKSEILSGDEFKFKKIDWTKDFAIGIWRGESVEYYFSWNDSYDTNNWSWTDGYVSFFAYCTLGLLPLIFWWSFYRRRRKAAHNNGFCASAA